MQSRSEPIWPGLLFLWAWWRLSDYPQIGWYAFFCAIALWFVGWIAIRMFSGAVHRLRFWGWVMLLEVTGWYSLALWTAPLDATTVIFLLWGIATPLLLVGNVWRQAYERFPGLQGFMHAVTPVALVVSAVCVPVYAWHAGPDFWSQLLWACGFAAAGYLCVWYGWRLAAPSPSGEYDARLGSVDGFRRRGVSYER
jgi:hypothetical protein